MNNYTPVNERTWPAEEVLTMACAIYRTKGYTSVSSFVSSDDPELKWNSKEHLCYQLVPDLTNDYKVLIKVTQEDKDNATAIINYYRRLTFGVIADSLNDYMQRVFSTTQQPTVLFKDFGVLASVPNVYFKEIEKKKIINEAKSTKQEHIGEVSKPIELNIRYINVRHVPKLDCYAHDAVTDTGHLVNFLNKSQLGKPGDTQKIRARVKTHGVNYTTKTIETQLNYVKPLDTILVWQ